MKSLPVFIVCIFLVTGCNTSRNDSLRQQNASLQQTNSELKQDIAYRDDYVSRITDSINAVFVSMEELRSQEKSLLKEESKLESSRNLKPEEIKARLFDRLAMLRATLIDDHNRLRDLQGRLAASKKQYAGLQKIVANLQKTVQERDQSIADLGKRIQGLERDVSDKTAMIVRKDSVLGQQHAQITTAYYVSGTRDELEKMGIIKKEGGFPWGLFGSTTIMTGGFDPKQFKPLDKTLASAIRVDGRIDEVLPQRAPQSYRQEKLANGQTTLTISTPDVFWKDKYLVIITDRSGTSQLISENNTPGEMR